MMRKWLGLILVSMIAAVLANGPFSVSSSAQRVFSHNTRAHKEGKYSNCASCHSLPTRNWASPRSDRQDPFPDVATFPSHSSCFGCHTKDIYRQGSAGAFCGACHTVPSMRARAVARFPVRSHPSQFTTLFPHDVHQDVIARYRPQTDHAVAHFVPVSFTAADDKKPTFYNCVICHETATATPKYEARKLTVPAEEAKLLPAIVPDTFEKPIEPKFFKQSPNSHASCFTCHYQYKNLPEGKRSCNGCHELTKPFREKDVVQRYSLKFNHEREGHQSDCATCHLRITQNDDIRKMKDADVPIVACRFCHAKQEDAAYRKIIFTEIDNRLASEKANQPIFQCTYCHTSAVGRNKIPASHLN